MDDKKLNFNEILNQKITKDEFLSVFDHGNYTSYEVSKMENEFSLRDLLDVIYKLKDYVPKGAFWNISQVLTHPEGKEEDALRNLNHFLTKTKGRGSLCGYKVEKYLNGDSDVN